MMSSGDFCTRYTCYSVAKLFGPNERTEVDKGGKIIVPALALELLCVLNVTFPIMFKLINKRSNRVTHCGVLEFMGEAENCYLPSWMMKNLQLEEGSQVWVQSVELRAGTYCRIQPQSPDFLDITDPAAALEYILRSFACLTKGDIIAINYNDKIYELLITDTKPAKAVSIMNDDLNVDFETPVGYIGPEPQQSEDPSTSTQQYAEVYTGFRAFTGCGNRIDGKTKGTEPNPAPLSGSELRRGVPNYGFRIGRVTFNRTTRPQPSNTGEDNHWLKP